MISRWASPVEGAGVGNDLMNVSEKDGEPDKSITARMMQEADIPVMDEPITEIPADCGGAMREDDSIVNGRGSPATRPGAP